MVGITFGYYLRVTFIAADNFPSLIARETEQQALELAVSAMNEGRGGVVMISGEPGIGKSALARWAECCARKAGIPVHWGFAWEAGGAPPFWPWTQCLRALLASHDLPATLVAPLRQLLPEFTADGIEQAVLRPEQARFQLLEAMRALLGAAAARKPFVLVFEDLHAADNDSLALLLYACQHASAAGYLLLGTFREAEASLADESSPLWLCARHGQHLSLQCLREPEVQALLEQHAGRQVSPDRAHEVFIASEGNPLYLSELIALLREDLIAVSRLTTDSPQCSTGDSPTPGNPSRRVVPGAGCSFRSGAGIPSDITGPVTRPGDGTNRLESTTRPSICITEEDG